MGRSSYSFSLNYKTKIRKELAAELAILGTWYDTISIRLPKELPKELQPPVKQCQKEEPENRIKAFLQGWAKTSPRPLVILIDEIDSLQAFLNTVKKRIEMPFEVIPIQ